MIFLNDLAFNCLNRQLLFSIVEILDLLLDYSKINWHLEINKKKNSL
jgi:hypothetical protein